MSMVINVTGVQCFELSRALSRLVVKLNETPTQVLPTVDEVRAHVAEEALVKEHPAVRLYVFDGQQLWLGENAVIPDGAVDAGPVPDGVKRACDFARDPDGFRAKYLTPEA